MLGLFLSTGHRGGNKTKCSQPSGVGSPVNRRAWPPARAPHPTGGLSSPVRQDVCWGLPGAPTGLSGGCVLRLADGSDLRPHPCLPLCASASSCPSCVGTDPRGRTEVLSDGSPLVRNREDPALGSCSFRHRGPGVPVGVWPSQSQHWPFTLPPPHPVSNNNTYPNIAVSVLASVPTAPSRSP